MAMFVIDPDGDYMVKVRVTEVNKNDTEYRTEVKEERCFKVSSKVLVEHSNYFKGALRTHAFGEGQNKESILDEKSIMSMELWLRVIHGLQPEMKNIDLPEVWRVILVCDRYEFEINRLNDWFARWYDDQFKDNSLNKLGNDDVEEARSLLFPCYTFDHARGFLDVTRYLVYSCAFHITEINPIKELSLRLPSRITQQLNAARGRIKTIIFNPLYEPLSRTLIRPKQCCDTVGGDYQRALLKTKAWPLEALGHKTTIKELLSRLETFRFSLARKHCSTCDQNYDRVVANTVSRARAYFDGLCLDCMNASKPKTRDSDEDYWEHNKLGKDDIVRGCRVKSHTQATWYFYFMGRREEQDRLRKTKRHEKKGS